MRLALLLLLLSGCAAARHAEMEMMVGGVKARAYCGGGK